LSQCVQTYNIDFADPIDAARNDRLVSLVEQML
jgi:hypothetical protein